MSFGQFNLNSFLSGWTQQSSSSSNIQSNDQTQTTPKKFRAKILDLYEEIFIQHKQIKTLEINFLHLKVHRNGLYQSIRKSISNQQYNQHKTLLMFNKTFQYCINSLLDEKLLIVQHAFQVNNIHNIH